MNHPCYLSAEWAEEAEPGAMLSKPDNVFAYTTLRCAGSEADGSTQAGSGRGGFSEGNYGAFNLASHVGDDPAAVAANRKKLSIDLNLPAEPVWLDQVHSNRVIKADQVAAGELPQADASVASGGGVVCAVLTADCLPVFFCNRQGTEVGVAHAGWRGLHAGILSATLAKMQSPAEDILVSLGPAIGPEAFEVGQDVYDAFVSNNDANSQAFITMDETHYLCDIYKLARIELSAAGVKSVAGGAHCSFNEAPLFYSYRRHSSTGHMASLIWIG